MCLLFLNSSVHVVYVEMNNLHENNHVAYSSTSVYMNYNCHLHSIPFATTVCILHIKLRIQNYWSVRTEKYFFS